MTTTDAEQDKGVEKDTPWPVVIDGPADMALIDAFATQAMALVFQWSADTAISDIRRHAGQVASLSYDYAAAMLLERKKRLRGPPP